MSAERAMRSLICGLALCTAGAGAAAEKEEPEVDFLEYLGMWEESDEDWLILDETTDVSTIADNEERSDPAPDGEESTEKEDES